MQEFGFLQKMTICEISALSDQVRQTFDNHYGSTDYDLTCSFIDPLK